MMSDGTKLKMAQIRASNELPVTRLLRNSHGIAE
jgi:hypothetical protein